MRINKKQQFLYKERINDRKTSLLSERKHSSNNFNETLLKRDYNNISFKGVSSLSGVLYKKHNYDFLKNINTLKRIVGRSPEVLKDKVSSWQDIHKQLKISANGEKIEILEKNWPQLLMESVVYPVRELPFHLAHSLKGLFKSKSVKPSEALNQSASGVKGFVDKKYKTLNNSDIVNSMIGYMDTAKKYQHDTEKVRKASIFTNSLKMFDAKSGNYNGVHERALTRIVTGFIPAFFLANDAYNLSRICDDDAQKAQAEKKLRFNQETKRVLSNAYLQLITLGALAKWINKSKAVFVGVTAVTVLITEALSRLSNGKKIHWINKDEAIAMNIKEGLLPANYKENPNNKPSMFVKAASPTFKGSNAFNNFGLVNNLSFNSSNNVNTNSGKLNDEKQVPTKELKPLLSISTIAKWFVGTIALGFALKHLKGVKINPNVKIGDYLNVISNKYNSFINSFTQKEFSISRKEFDGIINKLKEYDPTFGKNIETIVNKKQRTNKIKSISAQLAKVLEEKGLGDLAAEFKHISNSKPANNFASIAKSNQAKSFIAARDKKLITNNLNQFFKLLEKNGQASHVDAIKSMILKDGVVDTKNFEKTLKFINSNESLREYSTTFASRFMIDADFELSRMFAKAMRELKKSDKETANNFIKLVADTKNAQTVSLGKKNITGVKELTDFIQEPFKFLWGTITLPFKHIAKPISKMIKPDSKLPKWPSEFDAATAAMARITKKPLVQLPSIFGKKSTLAKIEYDKESFARYMDKQINKAFNTTTLSSMSNSELSAVAKNTSTAATIWFLTTDNHNMVMQKSNGNDKAQATLKAKERVVQETSRQLYNVMFINLFNNSFRSIYNSSMLGAQAVNTASTLIGEYVNRKAIGMPVKPSSRTEILNKEYENITNTGLKGKFFRFMTRLTGKKVLSQRDVKKS